MADQRKSDLSRSPIRFEGLARSLQAIVNVPGASGSIPVTALLEASKPENLGIEQPQVSARVVSPGIVRVKLRFARYVPPGTYVGRVRLKDEEHEFVAAVAPIPYIRISPSFLSLAGVANGEDSARLTLANGGNATFIIRPAYAFGVFQQGGVEEALGKSYREQGKPGERWIDRLGDNLSKAHGGLVRVKVEQGEGPLQPGELRELQLKFRFPDNLHLNRIYDGKLEFDSFICPVRIDVPKRDPSGVSSTQEI
jgi:hypothetical protein